MELAHTLGCSGEKLIVFFLRQYEVFKITVKWMFTPAGHHFSFLPGAFSSRNQVLKTPFELTSSEASRQRHFSSLLWVFSSGIQFLFLPLHKSPDVSQHYPVRPWDHILPVLSTFQQMGHTRANFVPVPRKTIIWGQGIQCYLSK